MRQHPSVQVVSRDRASSFADAIGKGALGAIQVADRWHLLNNLVETLGRSLERHRPMIVEVAKRVNHTRAAPPSLIEEPVTQALQRTQQNRERRLARYQEFRSLVDAGMSCSCGVRGRRSGRCCCEDGSEGGIGRDPLEPALRAYTPISSA